MCCDKNNVFFFPFQKNIGWVVIMSKRNEVTIKSLFAGALLLRCFNSFIIKTENNISVDSLIYILLHRVTVNKALFILNLVSIRIKTFNLKDEINFWPDCLSTLYRYL